MSSHAHTHTGGTLLQRTNYQIQLLSPPVFAQSKCPAVEERGTSFLTVSQTKTRTIPASPPAV